MNSLEVYHKTLKEDMFGCDKDMGLKQAFMSWTMTCKKSNQQRNLRPGAFELEEKDKLLSFRFCDLSREKQSNLGFNINVTQTST